MCTVRRANRREAVGVIGPVRPGHDERVALEAAVSGVPQIELGPGPGAGMRQARPSGQACPRNASGVRPAAMRTPLIAKPMASRIAARVLARPRAREVDGGQGVAGGLKRGGQRALRDIHTEDDRGRASRQCEHAAEHSRELLVRKQPRRFRTQPEGGGGRPPAARTPPTGANPPAIRAPNGPP